MKTPLLLAVTAGLLLTTNAAKADLILSFNLPAASFFQTYDLGTVDDFYSAFSLNFPTPTTYTISDLGATAAQTQLTNDFATITNLYYPTLLLSTPGLTYSLAGTDSNGETGTAPLVAIGATTDLIVTGTNALGQTQTYDAGTFFFQPDGTMDFTTGSASQQAVPEPASYALGLLALLPFIGWRMVRRNGALQA